MKRVELEKILKERGFRLVRSNKHSIWSDGKRHVAVPNKKEINKLTSLQILRKSEMDNEKT